MALDETANDSRGAYKNGVALSIPSAVPTDPLNTAAGFDGGNDRVEWPDSPVLDMGLGDFTMEGWVKTSVSPIDTERGIMSKRDPSKYWLLNVTDDSGHKGQLRAIVFDGTVTRSAYSLHVVDDGNWHHFAVRVDRDAGISFYVDGTYSGLTAGAHARRPGQHRPLLGREVERLHASSRASSTRSRSTRRFSVQSASRRTTTRRRPTPSPRSSRSARPETGRRRPTPRRPLPGRRASSSAIRRS